MPNIVLTNPEAPRASAQRLVAAQQRVALFPAALAEPVTMILGRWLGAHPDCLADAGAPDRSWCQAAERAHRQGQACATFRRRKRVTEEAENGLKWVSLVAGYAGEVRQRPAHADPAVRREAEKVIRALCERRITWDQLADRLKRVRSLVLTRGRQRAGDKAVRNPLTVAVSGGLIWREIVTPRELASVGRANGWCTQETEYVKKLKEAANRFFVLEEEEGDGVLALISLRPRFREVEGARAPCNKPIPLAHREAVQVLLDHFGIVPRHCDDLLALGLTSAVPDVDLSEADLAIGDTSVWFGPAGEAVEEDDSVESEDEEENLSAVTTAPAMLIRVGTSFALLRPMSRSMADARFVLDVGLGAYFDGDDLLGRLLIGMSERS